MKIDLKAIYTNLKNWDFEALGSYKLREEEAKALIDTLEMGKKENKDNIKAYLRNCQASAILNDDFEMQERLIRTMLVFDEPTGKEK